MSTIITKNDDSYYTTNIAGPCMTTSNKTPPSGSFSFIGGGMDNIISSGSSNIAIGTSAVISSGSSNIAYGTLAGGSISFESTTNPIWSNGFSYPVTYAGTVSVPLNNNGQDEKIERLETRIKELEAKLEKLFESISVDQMSIKIVI